MLHLKYRIHLLLYSNYKALIKIVVVTLFYFVLYETTLTSCMQDSTNSTNTDILRLIQEDKRLSENLNLLSQHNKELHATLLNVHQEKYDVLEQYQASLDSERSKRFFCMEAIDTLERNQDFLIEQNGALCLELEDAKHTIEILTEKNRNLMLNIAEQKDISDQTHQTTLEHQRLDNIFSEELEEVPHTLKKRKG